ncbi:hypothetical protein GY12_19310 [Micrococcus luteus]|nr:hypothetical protein GY12_19310 [Micrococcus luteus]
MTAQLLAHAGAVEDVVAEHKGDVVGSDVLLAEDERLGKAVWGRLLHIGQRDAELGTVAEEALELLRVVWGGDDKDVADAREDEGGQRVVDHRLVVDGDELLRDAVGNGMQPGARAAGEDDALHAVMLSGAEGPV